jgi:Na+/H+-dicarboxylate symporter/ABC-type amino acid transport substrate-binding protein
MNMDNKNSGPTATEPSKARHTLRWIAGGLLLGIACGVLFGEYCGVLRVVGQAYVGLLQMTVLPYLVLSLIAKTARMDVKQAQTLGMTAPVVLLILWLIGIILIVLVSGILPPTEGAAFFSPPQENAGAADQDFMSRFIPTNIFRSLSSEYIPAVVVFSLFFGGALMLLPGKEPLLDFLDLCCAGVGHINTFLVRLAPIGLFALTAAAAGTLRVEELSRLQAYLIMFTLACLVAAFGVIPLLVGSLTGIRYRDLLRAAGEPLLTAIATGKLFVVLPQISDRCEQLLWEDDKEAGSTTDFTASVIVPLAYPFPHVGKILAFVFISFAAWYAGDALSPGQTAVMATTGAVSSFASPLITIPYLLDQYQLPQDLMALFILPGFITTRLADVVGVMHLMAITLVVSQVVQKGLHVKWGHLLAASLGMLVCLGVIGAASRWYLASTMVEYDLDRRLLSLELTAPHEDVVIYKTRESVPQRSPLTGSTLERVKTTRVLRVGYHPDHLPYSFFNQRDHLVGLDVELMHHLAVRLQVRLEFVPYAYDTLIEQLDMGEIDVAAGGLMIKPERLLQAGFTQPYQAATLAVVVPDHRRSEFITWDDFHMAADVRLGVVYEDLAVAARRRMPNVQIVVIDSTSSFFAENSTELDGLIMAAEEGAVWTILYPEYTVVVPQPVSRRPVGMAVRVSDTEWLGFLDRWLDFESLDGSLDRTRTYWVEGRGTQERPPRWCLLRDALHWLP